MSKLSDIYRSKVEACLNAIQQLGLDPIRLVVEYDGQRFPDSEIDKASAFRQVLECELDDSTTSYFTQKCNLPYLRDGRQPSEYAVDLVLGWLLEDAVLTRVEAASGMAALSGEDRYREFLSPQKISTQPDIRIGSAPGRLVEVLSDWKGTWAKEDHLDLRDSKYQKLIDEEAMLLGIAPLTAQGFLIDLVPEAPTFERRFIPGYRKFGFTTWGIRSRLGPLIEAVDALVAVALV